MKKYNINLNLAIVLDILTLIRLLSINMVDTFYFNRDKELHDTPSQAEVQQWGRTIEYTRLAFKKWRAQLYGDKPKSFKITIDKVRDKELRGYWVLIDAVTKWMNEQGNNFTKEEVSDWFKMQSGHKKKMKGVEVPKSIAIKSGCTWQEMSSLIEYIERFGAENNIIGCELKPSVKEDIKNKFESPSSNG